MASVPQIPKVVDLSIATHDFAMDVVSARLNFTPGAVQSVITLDGVVHSDVEPGTWSLDLTAVQDWSSSRPGLAYYLWDHAGETAAVTFNPHSDTTVGSASQPPSTFTVTLVPLSYGGEANVFSTSEVSLPLTGEPLFDITP